MATIKLSFELYSTTTMIPLNSGVWKMHCNTYRIHRASISSNFLLLLLLSCAPIP